MKKNVLLVSATFFFFMVFRAFFTVFLVFALSGCGASPNFSVEEVSQKNSEENIYDEAIRLGGEWFLNNQNDDFLFYEYDLAKKIHPKTNQRLREMGALWSITLLRDYLNDPRYEVLAQKGFSFFERHFVLDENRKMITINITPKNTKLAYNAFAILTLLSLDRPQKDEYLSLFANGIEYQQLPSGELQTFFFQPQKTGVDYYPGEAIFSLMSLHEKTQEKRLLEVTKNAFPFYRDYWRGNKNTGFIPWQTRGYRKYFDATQKQEVADFIFEMNDWLLSEHKPKEECSHFTFSRGGVVSVFMEGVIQAYDTAEKLGDTKHQECYRNFVQEGSNFLLTLQVTSEEPYGKAALGGFRSSASSNEQRVDNNQHAVTALIDARQRGLLP